MKRFEKLTCFNKHSRSDMQRNLLAVVLQGIITTNFYYSFVSLFKSASRASEDFINTFSLVNKMNLHS